MSYAGPISLNAYTATPIGAPTVRSTHITARLPRVDPPIIFLHSAAGDCLEVTGKVHPSLRDKIAVAVGWDRAIYAPTQVNFPFGNAAVMTLVNNLCDWLDTYGHDTSQGIGLMGVSMGSTGCLRYAAGQDGANRPVKFVATFLTVYDLDTAYEQDLAGNRDGIGANYGVTWDTPLPANASPDNLAAQLNQVPMLLTSGALDAYGDGLEAWGAGLAQTTVIRLAGRGHEDGAIADVPITTVADFIAAHI